MREMLKNPYFVLFLMMWSLFWKGLALWKSSQKRQLLWFIILLVFNTLGILEICYVFWLKRRDLDNGRLLKFLEEKFGKKA
ncbi:MAG: DUF5652 family protein [Microgenomates group bacterium]